MLSTDHIRPLVRKWRPPSVADAKYATFSTKCYRFILEEKMRSFLKQNCLLKNKLKSRQNIFPIAGSRKSFCSSLTCYRSKEFMFGLSFVIILPFWIFKETSSSEKENNSLCVRTSWNNGMSILFYNHIQFES